MEWLLVIQTYSWRAGTVSLCTQHGVIKKAWKYPEIRLEAATEMFSPRLPILFPIRLGKTLEMFLNDLNLQLKYMRRLGLGTCTLLLTMKLRNI